MTSLPLVEWVSELVAQSAFSRVNGVATDFRTLADDATKQWTGQFNPRSLRAEDYVALYQRALA